MIKKRDKQYLSNKDLYCELIVSKAAGKLTRPAEKMLILIAKNLVRRFYYYDTDDKLDCLQNAYFQLFSNWYHFDEKKTDNPFSYFTEVAKRGLAASWKVVNKGRKESISIESMYDSNGGGGMNI